MASLLQYGGAIGGAISDVAEAELKRQMQQQEMNIRLRQQDESERSNRSRESYQDKALQENIALRMLQQDQLNQNRQNIQDEKENSRVLRTINLRPIGSPVTEDEFTREQRAGVPASLYDVKREGGYLTGEEQGPTMSQSITSKGTPEQMMALQRIKDAEAARKAADEDRDLNRQQQLLMRQMTEKRLWDFGPPTIVIAGPDGTPRIVPRGQANVPGGVAAPAPAGVQTQAINNEVSSEQLDRLKGMFDASGKNMVGPIEGRVRSLGQKIPGVPVNEDFANFEAETSAFRNSVIKAITGAQMSEVEANRIRQQIPEVNDKPEVWNAKYAQTQRNLKDLNNRLRARAGGGATASGGGNKRQVGRFVIEE